MIDFSPIIAEVYKMALWVIPALFVIAFFKSPWFKGWLGEWLVNTAAKWKLDSKVYRRLHNVTLPTDEGTTQIDHIIVSPYGVFVIETKNMKGWIFGGEKQAQWTQKIYRKSVKFQNPLRQNYKHVKALESALDLVPEHIHSVVVFAGESTFKTPMPANVTQGGGFVRYIRSFTEAVVTAEEAEGLVQRIETGRLAPTRATHKAHVTTLRERHAANPMQRVASRPEGPDCPADKALQVVDQMACPKCSRSMVQRVAKRGANAGQRFWGCSGYPQCRAVMALKSDSSPSEFV